MPTTRSVTVEGAALAPLRCALYSQLGIHADALALTAQQPDREATDTTAIAYRRLADTAQLLQLVAWTAPLIEGAVELQVPDQAGLALQALVIELEVERAIAAEATSSQHTDLQQSSRQRIQLITETFSNLRAACVAYGRHTPPVPRQPHGPGR